MKLALIFAFVAFSSLAGESVEPFLAAVTNVAPEKVLCRFLDYPPSKGKLGFPRCLFENPLPLNPDFYLKTIDFTCVSPWNDTYGTERAGTAISKRHIVCAKHFPLTKGTRIAFVGKFGDVSHYTIVSDTNTANLRGWHQMTCVGAFLRNAQPSPVGAFLRNAHVGHELPTAGVVQARLPGSSENCPHESCASNCGNCGIPASIDTESGRLIEPIRPETGESVGRARSMTSPRF